MTDEQKPPEEGKADSVDVDSIKAEIAKQMNEVKAEYGKMVSEKDAKIKELEEQNKQLNSAVIRSAILAPPAKEETEEDKYQKKVEDLSKKTIEMMKYL